MAPIKVIYITSLGHSGSTLLDVLLNQHTELQSVGEIMFLDEWMTEDLLCSCGESLRQCPFWTRVIANSVPALGPMSGTHYVDNSRSVFKAIKESANCQFIVDSSKSPQRLAHLLSDSRFDVRVIHLIRNGLAVTHSLRKSHARPGTKNKLKTLSTPVYKGVLRWVRRNKAIDQILKPLDPGVFLRVRYEDLCLNPEQVLQSICEFAGIHYESSMLHPDLTHNHNIGGSRWRFSEGPIQINLDEKWQQDISISTKLLFGLMGSRQNKKYGY